MENVLSLLKAFKTVKFGWKMVVNVASCIITKIRMEIAKKLKKKFRIVSSTKIRIHVQSVREAYQMRKAVCVNNRIIQIIVLISLVLYHVLSV